MVVFAGWCWLLKHFQRIWGSYFGSIFAWHENEGNGMVLLLHGDRTIFQKVAEYDLLFYCVNLQIVTVFFQKAYFLRLTKIPCNFLGWQSFFNQTEKTFFFNHFFGWQKKKPKNPFPGDLESMRFSLLVGCPWSWYRSSRGEQWLLNGRKGSQWSPTSRNKNVFAGGGGWSCWYCMFGGLAQQ